MPPQAVESNPVPLWKSFTSRQIHEALAHSKAGGIAVHCHRMIPNPKAAPRCFINAVSKGEDIAHLFDQNLQRLKAMARSLGVMQIVIEHEGDEGQHVDLCGAPLKRALAWC